MLNTKFWGVNVHNMPPVGFETVALPFGRPIEYPVMLTPLIEQLLNGCDLSFEQSNEAIGRIMSGEEDDRTVAAFLIALHQKGECATEVAGAAAALRSRMTVIRHNRSVLIDTCGTGGDGAKTFNISTAAALVTAAAGVPVAKHGNRAATSRSGSADVLKALGVNIEAQLPTVERCLAELGICFCFAPLWHPAMKRVADVRRQIPHPTIFNLLGPLTNPAGAPFQLIGVGKPRIQTLLAGALSRLGTRRSLLVHGSDGLDEVTLAGPTAVIEIINDDEQPFAWSPEEFGLERSDSASVRIDNPADSAEMIRSVLAGRRGPARDFVVANAAAAIFTAGAATKVREAADIASEAIDSGQASRLLAHLSDITHSPN